MAQSYPHALEKSLTTIDRERHEKVEGFLLPVILSTYRLSFEVVALQPIIGVPDQAEKERGLIRTPFLRQLLECVRIREKSL
jgi:hypothetical protein